MAYNLVRNSRLFFTTGVDATTGLMVPGSTTNTATFEIAMLDGFSFGQTTQQTTIQLSEAGNTPVRGQRSFNTAVDNAEVTFSTYMRPAGTGASILPEERLLWNALLHYQAVDVTGLGCTATGSGISRANTTANQATIACSATNFAAYGIAAGDVIGITGLTSGAAPSEWNAAAQISSFAAGGSTSATSVVISYLTAPSTSAGTTSGAATLNIRKGAFAQCASASDLAANAYIHVGGSNRNQLQKFALILKVDNAVYTVENCVVDQASIDFSLDGIATIAWTVKGTVLKYEANATISTDAAALFGGTGTRWFTSGTAAAKVSSFNYITNKLSTMTLQSNIGGPAVTSPASTTYTIALTGGNITIANNVNYVTPANLGQVNQPITYFTGTRSITGNVTAYLKTGTGYSAQLLADMVSANAAETKFKTQVEVGGASNSVHVDFLMNGCVLQLPTVEAADLMTTTINFTAQGYDPVIGNNTYDVEQVNDLRIRYFNV